MTIIQTNHFTNKVWLLLLLSGLYRRLWHLTRSACPPSQTRGARGLSRCIEITAGWEFHPTLKDIIFFSNLKFTTHSFFFNDQPSYKKAITSINQIGPIPDFYYRQNYAQSTTVLNPNTQKFNTKLIANI